MKILIFSDTHLSNKFEKEKFLFLKKIISNSDQVIINGDFWDGYLTDFDSFMNSKWKNLFPLLKSKKTIYIPGNHDKISWMNSRKNEFSLICKDKFEISICKKKVLVTHGNKLQKLKIEFSRLPKIKFGYINLMLEKIFFRKLNPIYNFFCEKLNNQQINFLNKSHFDGLIASHTHHEQLKFLKTGKIYINTGFIRHNFASFVEIINDKIYLRKEKY